MQIALQILQIPRMRILQQHFQLRLGAISISPLIWRTPRTKSMTQRISGFCLHVGGHAAASGIPRA